MNFIRTINSQIYSFPDLDIFTGDLHAKIKNYHQQCNQHGQIVANFSKLPIMKFSVQKKNDLLEI